MDEDGERRGRVVPSVGRRMIRLGGARQTLDNGVDGLEMTGIGRQHHLDVTRCGLPDTGGTEVVLHVTRAFLGVVRDGVDDALALELPKNLVVRTAEGVGEHVQAAPVGHSDDHLVGPGCRGQLDRLVEHRNHRVEALDRELLLPDERPAEVPLEPLDLGEPPEQAPLLVGGEPEPVRTRLDRLAEPDALLVVRDVLDLVRHRPAVRLAQMRQRLRERIAGNGDPQNARRDLCLELGCERRMEVLGHEPGIADGIGAKRVESRGEVTVHPMRLDQSHRRGDAAQQILRNRVGLDNDGSRTVSARRVGVELTNTAYGRVVIDDTVRRLFEDFPPCGIDRVGRFQVLVEEISNIAEIQAVDMAFWHRDPLLPHLSDTQGAERRAAPAVGDRQGAKSSRQTPAYPPQ